jgi:hypothetical protein
MRKSDCSLKQMFQRRYLRIDKIIVIVLVFPRKGYPFPYTESVKRAGVVNYLLHAHTQDSMDEWMDRILMYFMIILINMPLLN